MRHLVSGGITMTEIKFSPAYYAAIEEGRRHHASSKTYSGSLLRPHKPFLSVMVEQLNIRSALEIGAGKGRQWSWVDPIDGLTMEHAWGFDVVKHDPCWPPYEAEPQGTFDLVICAHTLALIPLQDQDAFLRRLYGFANKAVFIAEKIGERKKAEVADESERAINWPAEKWLAHVGNFASRFTEIETVLSLRVRESRGAIMTRYIWRDGGFIGAFEAGKPG